MSGRSIELNNENEEIQILLNNLKEREFVKPWTAAVKRARKTSNFLAEAEASEERTWWKQAGKNLPLREGLSDPKVQC